MVDQNQGQQDPNKSQAKVKVEVRARNEPGFRRLNRHFGTNPEEIEVTEEEYEQQLKNESQLIVRRLDGKDSSKQQQAQAGQASGLQGHVPVGGTLGDGSKPVTDEPARKR